MDLEKFKKHTNKPIRFGLENEDGTTDDFEFKPLNVDQFTTFMVIAEKAEKGEADQNLMKDLMNVYVDVVMNSYPELEKEAAVQFVITNFAEFLKIMEKLSPKKLGTEQTDLIKSKLDQIRKAQDAKGKDTSQNTNPEK